MMTDRVRRPLNASLAGSLWILALAVVGCERLGLLGRNPGFLVLMETGVHLLAIFGAVEGMVALMRRERPLVAGWLALAANGVLVAVLFLLR